MKCKVIIIVLIVLFVSVGYSKQRKGDPMIEPLTLSEQLLYNTIRIRTVTKDGEESVGSGFLYNIALSDKKHIPVIITNKHVIRNSMVGYYQLHESNKNDPKLPKGEHFTVKMDNFETNWISIQAKILICVRCCFSQ